MIVPESDLPLLHPLALQLARMFVTGYCREFKMSEEDQQDLANQLGATLHQLMITIEELIDVSADMEIPNCPNAREVLKLRATDLKKHLRTGVRLDWDDEDNGGAEPTPVLPVPVLTSTV